MKITLFTPTYNRSKLLLRLYKSIEKQSYKDFEWIIVDDGSKDNTQEIVDNIIKEEHNFNVYYYKKENGGKHTAINLGVSKANGELFFIADSDDVLPENALEIVAKEWDIIEDDPTFAGVVGLDCDLKTGKTIGSGLPKEAIVTNTMDIRYKYHVTGDMKEVFRTDVLKEFPFSVIEGERFCPEQLCWFRIAQKYKFRFFNKHIYAVEYQANGISAGIIKARMSSPILTMMTYSEQSKYNVPYPIKIKSAINYWRFRFCLNRKHARQDIPRLSLWGYFFMPFGWVMHILDIRKINQN